MSPFDDDKKCCLEAALQDGGEQTFNLSNKDVHISSIQPVPDHVKQELNPLHLKGSRHPLLFQNFLVIRILIHWIKKIQVPKDSQLQMI
jgi:hypothetical protein